MKLVQTVPEPGVITRGHKPMDLPLVALHFLFIPSPGQVEMKEAFLCLAGLDALAHLFWRDNLQCVTKDLIMFLPCEPIIPLLRH